MYKILILYKAEHNLWQQYGTTATSSASGGKSTFTEFATDDIEVLKAEILKLDQQVGHDHIKVYKDVTANFSVDIAVDNTIEDTVDIKQESNKRTSTMLKHIILALYYIRYQ